MKVFADKNKRIILFHCDVNQENIAELNHCLVDMITDDDINEQEKVGYERQPIHLHINSYGGTVDDMWSSIAIIRTSSTPIYTYCEGYAQSAGFCLFISGDRRVMYEGAQLMYHSLYAEICGKYKTLSERMDWLDISNQKSEEYVKSRTKISQKTLSSIRTKKEDFYIYDDDAIKLGCADEVIKFV